MPKQSHHTPPGFKPSPLGPIPMDWEVKKFCEILTEGKLGGNYENAEANNGIPVIKMGNVDRSKIKIDKIQCLPKNEIINKEDILKEGDLLFNTRNTLELVGKVAIWRNELPFAVYNSNLMRMKFDEKIVSSNWFMNYSFNSHYGLSQLRGIATGTTSVAAIYGRDLETVKFILPPLPEQHAIATCLSTWDEAIQKTAALIAQKEQRKKWLMQMLLTGEKRLKGFKETKWHLKSLEEVAEFKNGKAHENAIDENGKFIIVNSKFISTNGEIFKCSNENLSPLFKDDIVMVMSDIPNGKALAKCFYINENEKYTLNQRICSIKAYKNTNSKFLYFLLNRNIHYLGFDNGVGQTNLKKEEVLECPLILPEKEEQTAIAKVLQATDKEIELLKQKLEKLKEQKKGLMQVLLTGKKRLKIK
jgi:type I restriction enzyme S subunit